MTIDTKTMQQLRTSLEEALGASRSFQPVLRAEHEALKGSDLQALAELVERKKSLTETLLQASGRLLDWCADQGIEPDYQAFKAWAQALPDSDRAPLLTQWTELRQSLEENDRSSAVNRQILSSLTQRNQARMTLLKNLLGTPDTYSASGTRESGTATGWVDRV